VFKELATHPLVLYVAKWVKMTIVIVIVVVTD